jgi:HEAT repeat protein
LALVLIAAATGLSACQHRPPESAATTARAPSARPSLPEKALVALTAGAADLDVSDREHAIYTLVRYTPADGGGSWAPRGLGDPSPYVQRAAIRALAERSAEPNAREMLRSFGRKDSADAYNRALCAIALADRGDVGLKPELSAAWRRSGSSWDVAPLALAAWRLGDAEALPALEAALREGVFPLETSFFDLLGRVGAPEFAPALAEALPGIEDALALTVAGTLVRLGSSAGEARLREALASGREEEALEALDILADLTPEQAGALVEKARGQGGFVGSYAKLVQVGWGDGGTGPALNGLESRDRETRMLAFQALTHRSSSKTPLGVKDLRDARQHAASALDDESPAVQVAAIRFLGAAGLPEDVPALDAILAAEGGSPLRVEAAAAIVRIADRAAG